MKVPLKLLPLVSIPGFHYAPIATETSTSFVTSLIPTSTAIPTPPQECVQVSVTNYFTNGSFAVSLTRNEALECYILRHSPQKFEQHGIYYNLNMTCSDDGFKATFKEDVAKGAHDELFVDYFAEDGTEIFFEMFPLTKDQWLVEDGAAYKTYHGSAGCKWNI